MLKPEHSIKPETKKITVTTVGDVLIAVKWNKSTAAEILNCNRSTISGIMNDERENVVLVNGDGTFKLLK